MKSLLKISGTKKSTSPNFLVRICFGGAGVFHVNGVGAKKFGMSLETREIELFCRDIPGFCWDFPRLRKKKFVFNFWPLKCILKLPIELQRERGQNLPLVAILSNWVSNNFRNTPSTAGNSMTGSERPSPEPILKKEVPPAVQGGREFWKRSGSLKCLEL